MTQPELATAAGFGLSTIVDFEKERRVVSSTAQIRMKETLEDAGIEFIAENGGGPGVRLTDQVMFSFDDRNVIARSKKGHKPVYWVAVMQAEAGVASPDVLSPQTESFDEAREWAISGRWPKL